MIGTLLDSILGPLWPMLAGLAALVATFLLGWVRGGRRASELKRRVTELEESKRIRDEMDKVVLGEDPDLARRFLRERGKR